MFDVPVYAGESERPLLLDASANLSEGWGGKAVVFEADHYLSDGQVIRIAGFDITVIATPGHTAGGESVIICGKKGSCLQEIRSSVVLTEGPIWRQEILQH